jgi:hypothetical protein
MNQMLKDKVANNQFKIDNKTLRPIHSILEQFENLRNYINETLENLAEIISTPVPQFDKLFYWIPPASSDRIKLLREAEKKEAEKQASKADLTT